MGWVRPIKMSPWEKLCPGHLTDGGVTACRHETLCWGRAFWMGCLEEGTKVVKGRDQGILGRNKHGKTEGKWDKRGWWRVSEC